MSEKLIWSWSLQDSQTPERSFTGDKGLDRTLSFIALASLLFVLLKFIAPIIGPLPTFLFFVFFFPFLHFSKKKRKANQALGKISFLRIYTDGIKIKMQDIEDFYSSDDILLDTLEVQNDFGNKSLYFRTQHPEMEIDVSLEDMPAETIDELVKLIDDLKKAN